MPSSWSLCWRRSSGSSGRRLGSRSAAESFCDKSNWVTRSCYGTNVRATPLLGPKQTMLFENTYGSRCHRYAIRTPLYHSNYRFRSLFTAQVNMTWNSCSDWLPLAIFKIEIWSAICHTGRADDDFPPNTCGNPPELCTSTLKLSDNQADLYSPKLVCQLPRQQRSDGRSQCQVIRNPNWSHCVVCSGHDYTGRHNRSQVSKLWILGYYSATICNIANRSAIGHTQTNSLLQRVRRQHHKPSTRVASDIDREDKPNTMATRKLITVACRFAARWTRCLDSFAFARNRGTHRHYFRTCPSLRRERIFNSCITRIAYSLYKGVFACHT